MELREGARGHFVPSFLCCSIILVGCLASAQPRPYIGFAYPPGGQRGTSFQIRIGGQNIDDVQSVLVNGSGVTARIAENYRRLNPEALALVSEQAQLLRRDTLSESARASLLSDFATNMMTAASDEAASSAPK